MQSLVMQARLSLLTDLQVEQNKKRLSDSRKPFLVCYEVQ